MDIIWIVLIPILIILGIYGIGVLLVPKLSPPPKNLGVEDGRLRACPKTPNCVSTQATDEKHQIDPIKPEMSFEAAQKRMVEVIQSMPRTKIITEKANYIHVEFRSFAWRFVDDVEFYFDESAGLIHFHSASRIGRGDMGMNRKRMEKVRQNFFEK